jgi:rubrerythrin
MGSTKENLQQAFDGESQANRRYLFYAEQADEAGNKQTARLFREAAEAETVHARNHLRVLGEIKSVRSAATRWRGKPQRHALYVGHREANSSV